LQQNLHNIAFFYVQEEEIPKYNNVIGDVFDRARAIPGTLAYHCFKLNSKTITEGVNMQYIQTIIN
jgi:hypothetical protein